MYKFSMIYLKVIVSLRTTTHVVSVTLFLYTISHCPEGVCLLMLFKLLDTETIPRHSLHHQKSSTRSRECPGRPLCALGQILLCVLCLKSLTS